MAETKKDAFAAFDAFVETWGVKYDKAVECLIKDRDALLAFYDFPAEHWKHLRTTDVLDKRLVVSAAIFSRGKHRVAARATARVKRALPRDPTGTRRRFGLFLLSAGDRVAKSGEEDAISAALPFAVAPRLRRPRTPAASRLDVLFSVVCSTPPRNGNRLPRPARPTPARRHVRA